MGYANLHENFQSYLANTHNLPTKHYIIFKTKELFTIFLHLSTVLRGEQSVIHYNISYSFEGVLRRSCL